MNLNYHNKFGLNVKNGWLCIGEVVRQLIFKQDCALPNTHFSWLVPGVHMLFLYNELQVAHIALNKILTINITK